MTWAFAISLTIGFIIKIILTCSPSLVVDFILNKFALHSKLKSEEVSITIKGRHLEGDEKLKFIKYYNEAIFLKKYFIFPGNEKLFLDPETDRIPYVIKLKRGKNDVTLFVYSYNDHLDVVKLYKKKVVAYSLYSEALQKSIISA